LDSLKEYARTFRDSEFNKAKLLEFKGIGLGRDSTLNKA